MNFKLDHLNITFWNSATLYGKSNELKYFISINQPDVLLIQETNLKINNRLSIPNYSCYRDDAIKINNWIKHGTAIFIKNSIPHFHVPSPDLQHIEATIIAINPPNPLDPITIASIYVKNNPPPEFTQDLKKITLIHNKTIMAGDFNAKHQIWNIKSTNNCNSSGKHLAEFAENND